MNSRRTKFVRNKNRMELIITYRCNRKCLNCDAMVHQAPSNDYMRVEQVKKFVFESIEKNIKWQNIRVLGGEPTLHPNIKEIIKELCDYKSIYGKDTIITVVSNGTGEYVNRVLYELKKDYDIVIENSNKLSDIQPSFWPVNQAPIDMDEYKSMDFSKGCWITTMCGGALDPNGFYPCSIGAAIARSTGQDFGRKSLPNQEDTMEDLLENLCKLCGHYYNSVNDELTTDIVDNNNIGELGIVIEKYFKEKAPKLNLHDEIISKTWREILDNYKTYEPKMTKY